MQKLLSLSGERLTDSESLFQKKNNLFERNRDYANGTQDTHIYKSLLNSLDPNSGDGSLNES